MKPCVIFPPSLKEVRQKRDTNIRIFAEKQRFQWLTYLITQNKANITFKTSGQMVFSKINYIKLELILKVHVVIKTAH